MATYLGTHGNRIQNYTTDPSNPIQGEVWYDETANTIRFEGATTAGSWSTQNSMNVARQALAGAGSSTAALAFGGVGGGPTNELQNVTELWNGSAWTAVNVLNTGRG